MQPQASPRAERPYRAPVVSTSGHATHSCGSKARREAEQGPRPGSARSAHSARLPAVGNQASCREWLRCSPAWTATGEAASPAAHSLLSGQAPPSGEMLHGAATRPGTRDTRAAREPCPQRQGLQMRHAEQADTCLLPRGGRSLVSGRGETCPPARCADNTGCEP